MEWKESYEKGDYAEAYARLKELAGQKEQEISIVEHFAFCCYYLGKLEEADEYFLRTFELEPSLDYLFNILHVKYVRKLYKEVIEIAQRFKKIDPSNQLVLDMEGDSYYFLGFLQDALESYKSALSIEEKPEIKEKIECVNQEIAKLQERKRLENWADHFYTYSKYGRMGRARQNIDFQSLFKDQVIEYKFVEKLIKHNKMHMAELQVLDVGCGEGRWLRKFLDWGTEPEHLYGIDLNQEIIDLAKALCAPGMNFVVGHADDLPYEDKKFDVIVLVGVLQHILQPELQRPIGKELFRVLKDDGVIFTFHLNRRGCQTMDLETKKRIGAMGVEEDELKQFFGDCLVQYEDSVLFDMLPANILPDEWGRLYDLSVTPYAINQGYGFAVIRKNHKG